ncbi:MAG: hypothetical protein AB7L94_16375, partial [Kofleriaceae bacterium]
SPETTIDTLFGARTAEVVPDAITPALAAELRSRWAFTRYTLVDRGSYEHATVDEPALFAKLVEVVAKRAHVDRVVEARVLRLSPGDYLLAHHDRMHEGNPIEIVLDVSEAATPGAEVHYRRRGAVFFRVPSQPRSLSIVERGPTVTCNHTYVSKLHAGASVVRLVALLR